MKRLKTTLFLTVALALKMNGQAPFRIKGLWECYRSLSDTVNPDDVMVWFHFDNSEMSVLSFPALGLPPEKAGIVKTEKYKLKSDTLLMFSDGKKYAYILSVINRNVVSMKLSGEENEMIYLKRVIKK